MLSYTNRVVDILFINVHNIKHVSGHLVISEADEFYLDSIYKELFH